MKLYWHPAMQFMYKVVLVIVCSLIIILIIFSHLCVWFLGFSTFNKRPFLGFSILIIFSHLGGKFLGFWVFGFQVCRTEKASSHYSHEHCRKTRTNRYLKFHFLTTVFKIPKMHHFLLKFSILMQ
jgi:hypothetical protein